MKRSISICLLVFTISTCIYSQNDHSINQYEKARSIIADLDPIVTPNGIQETFQIHSGDEKQWVYVRGKNADNPIILFVHGGPASPMAPVSWTFQRPLEEYFTMVHYDQRASGKTYRTNDTIGLGKTIRIDQYVDDTIQIASHIQTKYKKKKSYLWDIAREP